MQRLKSGKIKNSPENNNLAKWMGCKIYENT